MLPPVAGMVSAVIVAPSPAKKMNTPNHSRMTSSSGNFQITRRESQITKLQPNTERRELHIRRLDRPSLPCGGGMRGGQRAGGDQLTRAERLGGRVRRNRRAQLGQAENGI